MTSSFPIILYCWDLATEFWKKNYTVPSAQASVSPGKQLGHFVTLTFNWFPLECRKKKVGEEDHRDSVPELCLKCLVGCLVARGLANGGSGTLLRVLNKSKLLLQESDALGHYHLSMLWFKALRHGRRIL